jgi:hypothetical protein
MIYNSHNQLNLIENQEILPAEENDQTIAIEMELFNGIFFVRDDQKEAFNCRAINVSTVTRVLLDSPSVLNRVWYDILVI